MFWSEGERASPSGSAQMYCTDMVGLSFLECEGRRREKKGLSTWRRDVDFVFLEHGLFWHRRADQNDFLFIKKPLPIKNTRKSKK